ncbi:hypothetical protein ABZS95_31325 [Streptomyces sp. NPDC005479]|uniref:hypothetical protein n=1 Tax=Streptomyces sp. NPDC005479 TaxID=3154879 RepID=UPI0033A929E6
MTAALIAVTGAASPATNAAAPPQSSDAGQGSVGVRLVDIPVELADDPRARHYIVDNLRPGTTVRRRIEVLNTTDSTLRVEVYPAAAIITHGSFVGQPARSGTNFRPGQGCDAGRSMFPPTTHSATP